MKKSSLLILIISTLIFAGIPKQISYQGILTDALGQPKTDGSYEMTFKLYNVASEGFNIWSETKTVNVKGGVFNTTLGSDSALTLPFDTTYWLGISVAGGAEFTPRVQLTASGYAIRSILADTSSFAHTAQVSVYADSSAKAYSSDIATSATNANYADSSSKAGIADSSVKATNADQATVAATVTSVPMAAIAANAIDSSKLGTSSVGSDEIADGSIVRVDVAATFKAPYADSADTAGYASVAGTVMGTSISGNIVTDTVMAEDSVGLALLANNKNGIHIDSVGMNVSGYLRSYANNTDSGYIQVGTASSGEMMPIISSKSESENIGLYFHTEPKDTLQKGYGLGAFFFNARGNTDNGVTYLDSGIVLNVSKNNSDTLFTIDIDGNIASDGEIKSKSGGFRFPDNSIMTTAPSPAVYTIFINNLSQSGWTNSTYTNHNIYGINTVSLWIHQIDGRIPKVGDKLIIDSKQYTVLSNAGANLEVVVPEAEDTSVLNWLKAEIVAGDSLYVIKYSE